MPATILVVDDSPTIILSLTDQLSAAGHAVETAMDGRQAIERLHAGLRPNVILTDLNMPVMDGLAFIREARRYGPTRFTPILVLTTETGKESEARAAGASGWLAKPVEPGQLAAAIERLLPP